jgi:uncharacterized protein YbbK (DUF523 family)
VTKEFTDGAKIILETCRRWDIKIAILKERSPSCGSTMIYDGTFSGNKIPGKGITASLLSQNGITVYSEETITPALIEQWLVE